MCRVLSYCGCSVDISNNQQGYDKTSTIVQHRTWKHSCQIDKTCHDSTISTIETRYDFIHDITADYADWCKQSCVWRQRRGWDKREKEREEKKQKEQKMSRRSRRGRTMRRLKPHRITQLHMYTISQKEFRPGQNAHFSAFNAWNWMTLAGVINKDMCFHRILFTRSKSIIEQNRSHGNLVCFCVWSFKIDYINSFLSL